MKIFSDSFIASLLLLFLSSGIGLAQKEEVQGRTTSLIYPADSENNRKFPLSKPPLIPMPRKISWGDGTVPLSMANPVFPEDVNDPKQREFIEKELTSYFSAHNVKVGDKGYPIRFELNNEGGLKEKAEAYRLSSGKDEAVISASSTKGWLYGWQTLRQLIVRRDGKTTLSLAEIEDEPRFPIRGFMNDSGRNYMDISLIKEEVEMMARYKMNVYHFHFTDNYGWRLESKKYPQLQDPASFERKPGKFYTQEQFVDFVEFCRLRNVMVIPELDMPGHTKSFRKALGVDHMEDPKVTGILTDLIKELATLVPADKMPYIHIGTDEAHGNEVVSKETLKAYFDAISECGRTAIRWQPGMSVPGEKGVVQQLWTGRGRSHATDGAEYIDSLENYLNHLDPLESIMTMFFKKTGTLFPKAKPLGGILCSWPDLYMEHERAHLYQTPVYPSIVAYSESVWTDPREKDELAYYSNLPIQGDRKLDEFREFEDRLVAHRDRFFHDKEFPYVRQSDISWKIIGPFPNGNKTETVFPVEDKFQKEYEFEGKTYAWSRDNYTGGTIIFKHYCDYPTFVSPRLGKMDSPQSTYYAMTFVYSPRDQEVPFWISGHYWPTSDFRTGPVSIPGKWFHADPQFMVNGTAIPAPQWKTPNRNTSDTQLPLVDENYHFRTPTPVKLKRGWNTVMIKSPHNSQTRRWMFTFVPVSYDSARPGCNIKEFPGLKFSPNKVL